MADALTCVTQQICAAAALFFSLLDGVLHYDFFPTSLCLQMSV